MNETKEPSTCSKTTTITADSQKDSVFLLAAPNTDEPSKAPGVNSQEGGGFLFRVHQERPATKRAFLMWIEYHQELRDHLKVSRLASSLTIPYTQALGLISCLWLWAATNAPDGDLSQVSNSELLHACRGENMEGLTLKKRLVESGLVDKNMVIHKWSEYGIKHLVASRLRQKKFRDSQQDNVTLQERNTNVTVTATVPTVPTVPKDIKDGGKTKRAATTELLKIFIPNLIHKVSKNVGDLSADQIKQLQSLTLPYCYANPDKMLELSAEIDRIATVLDNGVKPNFEFFVSSIRRTVNDSKHESTKQEVKKRGSAQPAGISDVLAGITHA